MSLGNYKCFESNMELRSAVINYTTLDNSLTGPTATTYGYPLASWCVDDVTDFSGIFQDLAEFNEYQLSNWTVSNAVDMSNMVRWIGAGPGIGMPPSPMLRNGETLTNFCLQFANASSFNQDLSSWDVSNVMDMSGMFLDATSYNQPMAEWNISTVTDFTSMLQGASLYNQSLCVWMDLMYVNAEVTDLFSGTSCPSEESPTLATWPVMSLCTLDCGVSNTTTRPPATFGMGGAPAPSPPPRDGNETAVEEPPENVNGTLATLAPIGNGTFACFQSNAELRAAVLDYVMAMSTTNDTMSSSGGADNSTAALAYGYPMNNWCFGEDLDDFTGIFADLETFNEEIYNWNTSRITSMRGMFQNAKVRKECFESAADCLGARSSHPGSPLFCRSHSIKIWIDGT
jgi:surface protein